MDPLPTAPLLVALTRSGITGQPLPDQTALKLDGTVWAELAELAQVHGLLPLVGAGLAVSGLKPPADAVEALQRLSRVAGVRVDRAWEQMGQILDTWKQEGIDAIALKGILLAARHYPALDLRPFGDIDLLVPADRRDAAAEALIRLGYQCTDDLDAGGKAWCLENHFHWKFMRAGAFPVELHWSLTFSFPPTLLDMEALWKRSVFVACPAGSVRTLGPEDEVLALAAHMTSHCFRLPLRCHADFAAILPQFTPAQWSCLWERAAQMGQERDLLTVLGVGRTLGFLDLPEALAARAGRDPTLNLPFLAQYAVESPFMTAPERWLDVQNAASRWAMLRRLGQVAFPRYTHLWTPQADAQARGRPALVYAVAWTRRCARLLCSLRDLPKLAADCRRTSRVHKMFGERRRNRS